MPPNHFRRNYFPNLFDLTNTLKTFTFSQSHRHSVCTPSENPIIVSFMLPEGNPVKLHLSRNIQWEELLNTLDQYCPIAPNQNMELIWHLHLTSVYIRDQESLTHRLAICKGGEDASSEELSEHGTQLASVDLVPTAPTPHNPAQPRTGLLSASSTLGASHSRMKSLRLSRGISCKTCSARSGLYQWRLT